MRVSVPAHIYFDVEAETEEQAKAAAVALVPAMEDGDDFWRDSETCESGRAYPDSNPGLDDVEVVDTDVDDGDDFDEEE